MYSFLRQKAPSAKRRIKTIQHCPVTWWSPRCQKAPSAKRSIKTLIADALRAPCSFCQKAPSTKRCIKTRQTRSLTAAGTRSESTEQQKVHLDQR